MSNGCGWPAEHCDFCELTEETLAAEAAQAEEEKWGDLRRELEWGLRDG